MTPKLALMNEYLNEREAIDFLGLDDRPAEQARESLRWMIRKHGLPCCKIGRVRMFRTKDLRDFIDKRLAQQSS